MSGGVNGAAYDEHCAELPNRAWRLDMDTVQDSLTSDWAATLNERVADAYMYGVKDML